MKNKVFVALLLCFGALGAAVIPVEPAAADVVLKCDANNPLRPANGAIEGMGSAEQWQLHQELFIPVHENRCPQTVEKVRFTETSEAIAIQTLQRRWVPNTSPAKPALFIGVNQPLTFDEWNVATQSSNNPGILIGAGTLVYHFPLMMDAFVVVANVGCFNPNNDPIILDPLTLSLIYSGAITRWNDTVLRQKNPWLSNCSGPIKISVRDGEAWSNAVIKDYMSKRNPAFIPLKTREQLGVWPGTLDISCHGASDLQMAICASGTGSISYMRYATAVANGLTPVKLENNKGLTPSPATGGEAWPSGCAAAVPNPGNLGTQTVNGYQLLAGATMALDWSQFSLTYGEAGYAMCAMSFVVTLNTGPTGTSQMEADAWKDHFRVMWAPEQQAVIKDYGYAPIPSNIVTNIVNSEPYANP